MFGLQHGPLSTIEIMLGDAIREKKTILFLVGHQGSKNNVDKERVSVNNSTLFINDPNKPRNTINSCAYRSSSAKKERA